MTIKDIARESGYAVGTVSRVLNDNPGVSAEARERILAVVRRHNYKPNTNAKYLKQQNSSGVALIVKGTRNMLLSAIVETMQTAFAARGYSAALFYIDEEADEVRQAELLLRTLKPCGIVFLGSRLGNFIPAPARLTVPCLMVTNSAADLGLPWLSSIGVNDAAAAAGVIDYLYGKGHRTIGIIGPRQDPSSPGMARLEGCLAAFERHGLDFCPERQFAPARFAPQGGYTAMEQLLAACPGLTAVFAMSDLMALGAVRALQDHGFRVPEQISVVGYDGLDLAKFTVPRLTTVRQDTDHMARRGVELLLRAIEHSTEAVHEEAPYTLVEGESVRAL